MRLETWKTAWLLSRTRLTLWARSTLQPRRSQRRLTEKSRYTRNDECDVITPVSSLHIVSVAKSFVRMVLQCFTAKAEAVAYNSVPYVGCCMLYCTNSFYCVEQSCISWC